MTIIKWNKLFLATLITFLFYSCASSTTITAENRENAKNAADKVSFYISKKGYANLR